MTRHALRTDANQSGIVDATRKATAWKPLAEAYHAHHFHCATCISAGQGRGQRCSNGSMLWTAYKGVA
jgi:hypothetical protein